MKRVFPYNTDEIERRAVTIANGPLHDNFIMDAIKSGKKKLDQPKPSGDLITLIKRENRDQMILNQIKVGEYALAIRKRQMVTA